MPKLFNADAILIPFVAVLINMGLPSLALQVQVQKQTGTEASDLLTYASQGSRRTESVWSFGDEGQSSNEACANVCASSVCDAATKREIDTQAKMEDLIESELYENPCTSYMGSDRNGPLAWASGPFVGYCSWYPGGASVMQNECTWKDDSTRLLCPCEIQLGTCSVSEDPHINGFDDSQISLLSVDNTEGVSEAAGEKWLVKSASVQIQARMEHVGNMSSQDRNVFTRAVAIGGKILNGNTMVIGSLDDPITWNGQPILLGQNSSFSLKDTNVFVNATRGPSSLVQDPSKENFGVNVRLRSGVSLVVNRLHHHLNVAIEMPPQAGGQEGLCGNFNGLSADDALEMSIARLDPNVVPGESLFTGFLFP